MLKTCLKLASSSEKLLCDFAKESFSSLIFLVKLMFVISRSSVHSMSRSLVCMQAKASRIFGKDLFFWSSPNIRL